MDLVYTEIKKGEYMCDLIAKPGGPRATKIGACES